MRSPDDSCQGFFLSMTCSQLAKHTVTRLKRATVCNSEISQLPQRAFYWSNRTWSR